MTFFIITNDISYSYKKARKVGGFACEVGVSNKTSFHCVFLDPNKCVFMLTCYGLNIGEKPVSCEAHIQLKVCMVCLGYMVCFVYMVHFVYIVCLMYRVYMVCLVCLVCLAGEKK